VTRKLKFNIQAIDGNFEREYDTVEEFKEKELGRYVGVSSTSMTSSDGICVYYPADDYTVQQIEHYQMVGLAKESEDSIEVNTKKAIANGCGLGYTNLYIMQMTNQRNGNDGNYFIDTDSGRFFIETTKDNAFFEPMKQNDRVFEVNRAKKEQMMEAFSSLDLGFGLKKKEGINCFLLDTETLLIQDTNKRHQSIDSIRKTSTSNEKGVVATIRTKYYDGNEDTPGSTTYYHPAVISADKETYFNILNAHYPERIRDDEGSCYDYDEKLWLETKEDGFLFDKSNPLPYEKVTGFQAKILKGKEVSQGEVILIDKDFLESMNSIDESGLTVRLPDFTTVYMELGKAYEATGSSFSTKRAFTELENAKFSKIPERDIGNEIQF